MDITAIASVRTYSEKTAALHPEDEANQDNILGTHYLNEWVWGVLDLCKTAKCT